MRFDDSIYYFHVPVNVLELNIDADMKLVYMVLCSFTNSKTDLCYPSLKTIAKKAGLSVRQTMRAIKKLIGAGLIEIIEKGVGRGHKNVYKVIVPGKSKKEEKKSENILPLPSGLLDELKAFGFSENDDDTRKIKDIYMQKGEGYIRSALKYAKKHAKTNKRAYLLQTLEKDWAAKEREEMEKQSKYENAKQEYQSLVGKSIIMKGKEYLISESGIVGDKDAVPLGYVLQGWDKWKPFLMKSLTK